MGEEDITNILGKSIRTIFKENQIPHKKIQEIRLRIGKPLIFVCDNHEWVLQKIVTKEELRETLDYVSNYSLHAYENELRQGFITIEGGHRVGVTGQALIEGGELKNVKHISSINIRISHEVLDCANIVMPYIVHNKAIYNTLIISPPGCGKTTLLRDLIRQISDGNQWVKGVTVGVVDERSEIAGCHMGIPQNYLGIRTDVWDCCPKAEGMLLLIRSMTPQVIAVDEIGGAGDIHALEYALNCGCRLLTTVHGTSMEEIRKKPLLEQFIKERQFRRYIVLTNKHHVGEIDGIYDERGSLLFKEVR